MKNIITILLLCLCSTIYSQKKISWKGHKITLEKKKSVGYFPYTLNLYNKTTGELYVFFSLHNVLVIFDKDNNKRKTYYTLYSGTVKSKAYRSLKKTELLIAEIGNENPNYLFMEIPGQSKGNARAIIDGKDDLEVRIHGSTENSIDNNDGKEKLPVSIMNIIGWRQAYKIKNDPEVLPPKRRFGSKFYDIITDTKGVWHVTGGYKFVFTDASYFWHPDMSEHYPGIYSEPRNYLSLFLPDVVINGKDCTKITSRTKSTYTFPNYVFCEDGILFYSRTGLKILRGFEEESRKPVYFVSTAQTTTGYNFLDALDVMISSTVTAILIDAITDSNNAQEFEEKMEENKEKIIKDFGESQYLKFYETIRNGFLK